MNAGETIADLDFGNQRIETVNNAPVLNRAIADQTISEDQPFDITLPIDTFKDSDLADQLTYSAEPEDGSALPTWLNFDDATLRLSGTPTNSDVGSLTIKVIATDRLGESTSDRFTLTIENTNDVPTLQKAVPDKQILKDIPFTLAVPYDTFTDIDADDSLLYAATLADGSALPIWLTFDPTTRSFSGTPTDADIGSLGIKIAVTDGKGAIAEDSFDLIITRPVEEPANPDIPEKPKQLTPITGTNILDISQLDAIGAISLQTKQNGVSQVNEILVFATDILGENKTQVASFSLIKGRKLPHAYKPEFTLDRSQVTDSEFLQFEIVQNGLARIATPTIGEDGQVTLDFGSGTQLIASLVNQAPAKNLLVDDAAAIDLTGETGLINVQFTVYREAKFNNTVGFYTSDDAEGGIQDPLTGTTLRPGQADYKAAVLDRQLDIKLAGQNGKLTTFSSEITGGGFLGTFLIVNGSNPLVDATFFSHAGVNSNNNDHVKALGNNIFGFEDLAGLGDRDFNDTVVQFSIV